MGVPTPIISWYKDGIPLIASNRINLTESGILTVSDLHKDTDQGLYTCVASSRSGKSTWSGYLRLEIPTNPNIKFFRAPEPEKIPSPPSKPEVVNVTDDSITISWLANSKNGASDIVGYSIEIFSNNMSKSWMPVASRVTQPVYTQRDLKRGASYIFVVRAENMFGISPPSLMSESITTGKPIIYDEDLILTEAQAILSTGDVVELLEANATDPTSVRLVWEILNAQYVEGFYIYARKTDGTDQYKMLTVLHGGGASTCLIEGLKEYSDYEFFLVPFYKTVKGRPSNSKIARTMEDSEYSFLHSLHTISKAKTISTIFPEISFFLVPTEPPNNLEALLVNATAISLKWQSPPEDSINGALLFYQIIIRNFDSMNISHILANMSVEASSPHLLLANLTNSVTYSVSIAAATRIGIGVYSKPAILRLDPHTRKLDQEYTR